MSNDSQMNRMIEQNLIDLCVKVATLSSGVVEDHDEFSYAKNEFIDWYSKIFRIRLRGNIEEQIERMILGIAKKKLPKNLLMTSDTVPNDLEKHACKLGFKQYYVQTGMAMPIDECPATQASRRPGVRPVTPAESVYEPS